MTKVYSAKSLVTVWGQEGGLVPSDGVPKPPKAKYSSQGGVFEGQIDQKWKNYHFFLKIKNSLMISLWDVNYGLVRIRGHRTTNWGHR